VIRVAILADTHGSLDARVEALVTDCDLAVHGGDIGNAGVLERLRPRRGRVIAVTGNNDLPSKWPLEQQHFLDNCESMMISSCRAGRWQSSTATRLPPVIATSVCAVASL
jgi:predicted phosphodiesterase